MDNPTLIAAARLLTQGRQYKGIQEEKHHCLEVMAERFSEQ